MKVDMETLAKSTGIANTELLKGFVCDFFNDQKTKVYVNDLLKYIAENDMIDLSYVQEQVKMKRREEILKRHHYTIWHSEKEDVWYTYLPDNSKANNRKKIKRKITI